MTFRTILALFLGVLITGCDTSTNSGSDTPPPTKDTTKVLPPPLNSSLFGGWKGTVDGIPTTILLQSDSQFVLLEIPTNPSAARPAFRGFGTWGAVDSTLGLRMVRRDSSSDARRWTILAPMNKPLATTFRRSGDTLRVFDAILLRIASPLDSIFRPDSLPTPIVSPEGRSSFSPVTVAITTPIPGAKIHYTLDGSNPTRSSPVYSAPFSVASSSTVKAATFLVGSFPSPVASSTFRIAPSLVGTWTGSNAEIKRTYTFNGDGSMSFLFHYIGQKVYLRGTGTWSLLETGYSYEEGPVDTSRDGKTWVSLRTDPQWGTVTDLEFSGDTLFLDTDIPYLKTSTGSPGPQIAATPVSSLPAGTYKGEQLVSLTSGTPGAVIRYELDNQMVTDSSPVYTEPIVLRSSTILVFVASKPGMISSAETSVEVEINSPDAVVSFFMDGRDGKTYPVVQIGTQKWMAANLEFAHDSSWCTEQSETACTRWGRLYGLNTALAGASKVDLDAPKGVRGICPEGSHLPSFAEWTTLASRFGGWEKAGTALAALSSGGTDDVGMSILLAGARYDGEIYDTGFKGTFWTASGRNLEFSKRSASVTLYGDNPAYGYSVRCLLD